MNPQPLEYVLGPEETLEIMEKGTELEIMEKGTDVSCKLVEVLINSGKGIIGMSAAVFGLAKAMVFINELIRRKGYDTTAVFNEAKLFYESFIKTEEYQNMLDKAGL